MLFITPYVNISAFVSMCNVCGWESHCEQFQVSVIVLLCVNSWLCMSLCESVRVGYYPSKTVYVCEWLCLRFWLCACLSSSFLLYACFVRSASHAVCNCVYWGVYLCVCVTSNLQGMRGEMRKLIIKGALIE
jgi:hypothetical protein